MKKRGRILGATLAAALSALASRGHASGETTEAAGIDGTIRVFGCAVEPGDLMVRARPIHVAAAPGTATLVVKAFSAEAPDLFAFRFDGLEAGTPYRIGVRFLGATARRCPQFAWSVDREPLVLPGDPSLAFRGFAVRSKLEMLATTEGREDVSGGTDIGGGVKIRVPKPLFVGADTLNFRDPAMAVRTLRWQSDLPGVTGGQLQISLKPFPRIQSQRYNPCGTGAEAGVIHRVNFDAAPAGESASLTVDFNALLLGSGDPSEVGAGVDAGTLAQLDMGMPVYLRVIPNLAGALNCDPGTSGTPPEVIAAHVVPVVIPQPPPPPDPRLRLGTVTYTQPLIGKQPYPGEVCYRVTKPHKLGGNPLIPSWDTTAAYYANSADIVDGTIREGAPFCVPQGSDDDGGWFDSVVDTFGSVLSAVVDGLGKLVNYISNLWEEIKAKAVDSVANVLTDLKIANCGEGSLCRQALTTGLEIALASMGVPPSLPNFDELTQMGFDYMAEQAASEVGAPDFIADYASEQAQNFVKKVAADLKAHNTVPGLPDWLVPDLHFNPAFLTMELFGMGLDQPYLSRPGIIRGHTSIFAGAFVLIPQRLPKPGEKPIVFPMVLPPNLEDLPDPPSNYDEYQKSRVDKNNWVKQRYTNGCYNLVLIGLSDPGGLTPLFNVSFFADTVVSCTP